MIAALLAAATVGALPPGRISAPPIAERTPNLYQTPARCKDQPYRVVDRDGRPLPQKLADLPPGGLLYAVDREIDGCRVTTIVWGNVKPDDPNPQPPAAPTATPAKREDAPSNRR